MWIQVGVVPVGTLNYTIPLLLMKKKGCYEVKIFLTNLQFCVLGLFLGGSSSPLLVEPEFFYLPTEEGLVTCINISTGPLAELQRSSG